MPAERHLTPAEAAERLSVSSDQILALIRSGRLRASNVGCGSVRPRYRIAPEAIEDLLAGAVVRSPAPKARRRASRQQVTQYFS